MEGKDLDPRPARLGHDAGGLGHDHRARPQADARHGRRVPVAAAARRPNQGIRAERSAPRPEDRAPGRPGDDLGPAGHPAQPARRVAARLRVPEERHAGDRGRDRRGAQRAPPRPGAGVRRVRGQRRRAAGGNPGGVPVARETRSAGGLAAALGARGPARDESRRRGLGPAGRAWGRLDALLGSDGAGPRAVSAFVRLDGVRKQWSHTVAVGPLSLEIPRGEILVLLGPSGSGKTTVLRLLGGFETPDAGRIEVAGEDVTAVPPARRRCGMVFQHYALFPHLDVGENVAFGLPGRGTSDPKVAEVLALVGLAGFERRRVQELSRGQQQRVALARALAPEPRVLLLDEPLSNLDPSLRERTRRELRALIKRVGITTMFVTHEQEEAFDLGDRLEVLARPPAGPAPRADRPAPSRPDRRRRRPCNAAPARRPARRRPPGPAARAGPRAPGREWPRRPGPSFPAARWPGPRRWRRTNSPDVRTARRRWRAARADRHEAPPPGPPDRTPPPARG